MLNFAQFSATMALNGTIQEIKGEVDPTIVGRLQSSLEDRNWDSIEALWRMKEEIKGDEELRAAFEGETAGDVVRALEGGERGRAFLRERLRPYQQEFGYKSIWSHEFSFPTWVERPAPTAATSGRSRPSSGPRRGSGPRPRRLSRSRTSRCGAFRRSSTAGPPRRSTRCTGSARRRASSRGPPGRSPRSTSSTRSRRA